MLLIGLVLVLLHVHGLLVLLKWFQALHILVFQRFVLDNRLCTSVAFADSFDGGLVHRVFCWAVILRSLDRDGIDTLWLDWSVLGLVVQIDSWFSGTFFDIDVVWTRVLLWSSFGLKVASLYRVYCIWRLFWVISSWFSILSWGCDWKSRNLWVRSRILGLRRQHLYFWKEHFCCDFQTWVWSRHSGTFMVCWRCTCCCACVLTRLSGAHDLLLVSVVTLNIVGLRHKLGHVKALLMVKFLILVMDCSKLSLILVRACKRQAVAVVELRSHVLQRLVWSRVCLYTTLDVENIRIGIFSITLGIKIGIWLILSIIKFSRASSCLWLTLLLATYCYRDSLWLSPKVLIV